MPAAYRPPAPSDAARVRALAASALGEGPHGDELRAALEHALAQETDEHRAIVSVEGNEIVGVIVFGEVAGARGAGRIHLFAVDAPARSRGIARHLIDVACEWLRERSARFVTMELPADSRLAGARRIAERAGFREEGRIDDYIRDGVALLLLRRDLGRS